MTVTTDQTPARPTTLAFVNCANAAVFGRTVDLTAREKSQLCGLLVSLQEAGLVLGGTLNPARPDYGYEAALEDMRHALGAHVIDALLAGVDNAVRSHESPPTAVMPVWEFQAEGQTSDVMLSSGRLWGTDLLVEALRVTDDEAGEPVPAVRERYLRWAGAAGARGALKSTSLPGHPGSYVLFAAAAPV